MTTTIVERDLVEIVRADDRTDGEVADTVSAAAQSGETVSPNLPWSVLEAVDTPIAVTQPNGTVVYANAQLARLIGVPATAIVGSMVFRLFDSKSREELERLHAEALITPALKRTEVGCAEGTLTPFLARLALRRSEQPNENFVVWSVSGADPATWQGKPLELALRGAEVGLWDWDITTDTITWINDWCEQWGLSPFGGIDHERLWTAQLHEEDMPSYRAALERHLAGRTHVFDVEYRLRNQRGAWVWVQERGRVIERDASGRALRMAGLCLYVDERHRTAQALARSESKFQLAVWGTQVGFWDVNAVTDEVHWWNDWCASVDLDPCEGRGHLVRWNERIHPDDLPFTLSYEGLVDGRTDLYEAEYRLRTRAGGWRWVLCRGRATARDGSGRALRLAGVTIDIDARKRAELALRETEVRLETAIWGVDIGLWDKGSDGRFRFLNDWCDRVDIDCPYDGRDQYARWRAQIHPEDVQRHAQAKDDFYRGGADQYDIEYRVRTRGGHWRWLLERGKVLSRERDGTAERIVGVCIDISEHKRTEAALHDAEDRYELAIQAARLPVWEYDVPTDIVKGNVYWHRAVGYDLNDEEAGRRTESWMSDVHPEDAPRHANVFAGHLADATGFYQNELRIKLPNGEYRWLLDRARVVERNAEGEALKVIGISIDIDAQKQLQACLRASQAQLETAIYGSDLGLWDWNVDTGEMIWLSDWPGRFGIDVKTPPTRRRDWLARVHPDDPCGPGANVEPAIYSERDDDEREYRVLHSNGEWRWVHVRTKVVERDLRGRARRVVGACIDVDVRHRAEELLRTQAKILETMREGIVLIDLAGRIELTNPAFESMFRCSAADLIGSSIADFLATVDGRSTSVSANWVERLRDQVGTHDIAFRRRDGTTFTGEVLIATIALAAGKRWLVVVQDVSERKRLEQEVLDIGNRERRRIGHELHDGLCQELTGVALMLRSIATHLRRDVLPTDRQLGEIVALVNSAIEGARTMARGLSPVTIDRGGLLSALDVLVHRARASSRIDVRLHVRMPANWTIAEATASHLYRIAQEALNNAVMHAAARTITVALQAVDDDLQLSVSDNGTGLPAGTIRSSGMGLKIMDYRARMIGGYIDIAPRRRGGTRVRCVCPALARDREIFTTTR
jgi:PAS domain S-box-containing protein